MKTKLLASFCVFMTMMFSTALNVYADTDIFATARTTVETVTGHIINISTAVGILFFVIALLIMLVSKNQRAVDDATAWMKRILIAVALINAARIIIPWAANLISG